MISIVCGGYNSRRYLKNYFDSLYRQTCKEISEIIFVDNGSKDGSVEDGSVEYIEKEYPGVKVINMGGNVGFCRQYNRGIRESSGKYVFVSNVDMILTENYIEEVFKIAQRDNQIGRVAGKLYFMKEDGTPTKMIDSFGHMIDKGRWHVNLGEFKEDNGSFEQERYIFGVCGAAGFYRREMLEDIALGDNYFDEMHFQTIEDVDLDWRAELRGWRCYYTPKAVAYHVRKGSCWDKNPKIMYHNYKNRYLLLLKNDQVRFVFKYLPDILWHEVRLFCCLWRYPVHKTDRIPHLKAITSLLFYIPKAYLRRRAIQFRARASGRQIDSLFEKSSFFEADIILKVRKFLKRALKNTGRIFVILSDEYLKISNSEIKESLIIDTIGSGHLINSRAFLKTHYNKTNVTIITSPETKGLVSNYLKDDKIITPDSKLLGKKYALAATFYRLRKRYDLIVITSLDVSTVFISLFFRRTPRLLLYNKFGQLALVRPKKISEVIILSQGCYKNRELKDFSENLR